MVLSAGAFDAADLTQLTASNIKRGSNLIGVTGTFPSASSPLPRYADDGASTAESGTTEDDLTAGTFVAQVTSSSSFEYWSSTGVRHSSTGDSNIVATNIVTSSTIFGIGGTMASLTICADTNQGDCESDSSCRWEGGTCEVDPWQIRAGITLAGQTGTTKMNCRNRIRSSLFNTDTLPPTHVDNSGVILDWWDTVDNKNGNWSDIPSEVPSITGWDTENACSYEIWTDVTIDGSCDSANDDCMMLDNVSGLVWSESHPVSGAAPSDANTDWSSAVALCEGLDFGGRNDWRLPTQIEFMAGYAHGLRSLGYSGGTWIRRENDTRRNNDFFIANVDKTAWTATTRGAGNHQDDAWTIGMDTGNILAPLKTDLKEVVCVAP